MCSIRKHLTGAGHLSGVAVISVHAIDEPLPLESKMKVQRFITVLMVSILLMALSACGGETAPEAATEDTSAPAVEEVATEAPVE